MVFVKKLLPLFLLFCIPLAGLCQITPSIPKWVTNFGSNSGSAITSASRVDAQNNVYVTGPFFGTVDFDPSPTNTKNLTAVGNADAFVAKYNTNGELIWAVGFGGDDVDQGNGIAVDDNGNVSVVGQFYSFAMDADPGAGVFMLNNSGNADMFLINLNSNGGLISARSIGSSGADFSNKVAIDKSGAKIIGGQFQGSLSIGNKTLTTSASFSALVAKFNVSGNPLWAFNIGNAGNNLVTGASVDNNENIIVTGVFNGTADFNPLGAAKLITAGFSGAAFVAKYTPGGQLIWVKSVNGGISACNLALDSQGNIYAVSPYVSQLTFDNGYILQLTGIRDVSLAKYAPDGTFIWAKSIGGNGAQITNYEVAARNDDIYFSGFFNGTIDFDPSSKVVLATDHGLEDIFLVRYDADGNYKWVINTGNSSCTQNIGRTVAVDYNNDVILGGAFCSTVNFDVSGCTSYNLTAQSVTRDGFLAKYIPAATGIANNTITSPVATSLCAPVDPDIIQGSLPTGGTGVYTYRWQKSNNGVDFTDIAGATAINYNPPSVNNTTYFRRLVKSGSCNIEVISNVVKIDVIAVISSNFILAPPVIAFCYDNNPLQLTAMPVSGGTGVYVYQWQISNDGINFSDVPGATSQNFDPETVYGVVYYRRKVTSGGCETLSNVVKVEIQAPVNNNLIMSDTGISPCASDQALIITASLPTGGNGIYNYQWQTSGNGVDFVDIAGENSKDYTPVSSNANIYYRRIVTSGLCGMPSISNVVQATVLPPLAANQVTAPSITTFCASGIPGSITGSLPTGGNNTYTYQWQTSTDGSNFTDISGATLINYDPPVIDVTTYYRRKVTSGSCDALSNIIQIVIEPAISNNTLNQPTVTSFCGNLDPVAIAGTTPTGGNGIYAFQWQSSSDGINFNNIPSATSADYDPPVITHVIYFRRVVSSGACAVSTSNKIQFSTTPALANNQVTPPATLAFCGNGDPDVLRGSSPNGGDGNYIYQWQSSTNGVNFTDIAGAVFVDYDPLVINATTYYRRKVLSGACELVSNVVQITVQPVLSSNTITPQSPTAFCAAGDAGLISGSIPPAGVIYNYQWQSSTDGITFADISGANAASYDPPLVTQTIYYRRLVSSSVCVVPLISNVVVINVDPALSNNSITPPTVSSFCNTGSPGTIMGSLPIGGNGIYSFQWQVSTDGTVFSNIVGATQPDFNPNVLNSTAFYRRIIKSGNCTVPNISNVVKITIDPLVNNNVVTSPAITSFCGDGQPDVITGSTPSGGNGIYVYQWQRSANNINFMDVPGATQKDYTPAVLSSSTYYRRVVTSGSCNMPLTSNAVFFQITPVIQNNNITSPATVSFCASGDPAIVIGSTPTGGTGAYSYQWQSSTDGVNFSNIPGATLKDFDPPLLNVTTYCRRLVTSGVCNVPQVSNTVSFTIDILPVIDLGPEVSVCIGSGTMLNPSGGNAVYTYTWSPATGLSNPGVANPIASPLVNTTYTLTVTNGTCITTSTISIKVIPKPIVSAGADKEVFKGNSVLLSATATGNNLKYSWSPAVYLDNPNIAQPTASPTKDITYTLTVTSENNCFTVYDDVFVRVYPGIKPPNTFSPNNDGINDVWTIPGLSLYKNTTVSIFNRNGEMLYQSINYTKEWDGTYGGKPVPSGTYYYIIDIKDAGIASTKLSGWVSVVR